MLLSSDSKTKHGKLGANCVVPHDQRAWRSGAAISLLLLTFIAGLSADLLSKHYVFKALSSPADLAARMQERQKYFRDNCCRELTTRGMLGELRLKRDVLPGICFTLSLNAGAVFGMTLNESPTIHRLIVGAATLVAAVLVLFIFASSHRRAWYIHIAGAFVLAGAFGNLYDRMFSRFELPGMKPILYNVRDFIDCSGIPLPFGFRYVWVFNVADVLLVLAVSIWVIHWVVAGIGQRKARLAANSPKNQDVDTERQSG